MEIQCSICGNAIGDAWVEIIVRDKMGGDFVHAVGFVDTSECLIRYASEVARNKG